MIQDETLFQLLDNKTFMSPVNRMIQDAMDSRPNNSLCLVRGQKMEETNRIQVRHLFAVEGLNMRQISKKLHISRKTVKKILRD